MAVQSLAASWEGSVKFDHKGDSVGVMLFLSMVGHCLEFTPEFARKVHKGISCISWPKFSAAKFSHRLMLNQNDLWLHNVL